MSQDGALQRAEIWARAILRGLQESATEPEANKRRRTLQSVHSASFQVLAAVSGATASQPIAQTEADGKVETEASKRVLAWEEQVLANGRETHACYLQKTAERVRQYQAESQGYQNRHGDR